MTGLAWFLTIGAVYRTTLLVTSDEITRPPREFLLRRWGVHDKRSVLITCQWCASVWLAWPLVASGLAWSPGWGWQLVTGALTASSATGFLSRYASPD